MFSLKLTNFNLKPKQSHQVFTKSFHQIFFYKKNQEEKQPFHSSVRQPAETPIGRRLHGAGAQVLAGRHGDDHLPHGMPRTRAGLAVAACSASRAHGGLTTLNAGLARGPSEPVLRAASLSCSGTCKRWWGVNRRRAWCRTSGDQA